MFGAAEAQHTKNNDQQGLDFKKYVACCARLANQAATHEQHQIKPPRFAQQVLLGPHMSL